MQFSYILIDGSTVIDATLELIKAHDAFLCVAVNSNILLIPSFLHHGYVINVDHVSRINLGKNQCYLLNNEISLPFSRTYKDNISTIIIRIS